MKNAMKKLFSLLLVAVLLVSAVPVAFAEEAAPCEHDRGTAYPCRVATCTKCGESLEPIAEHNRAAATCTTPKKCVVCGSETGSADGDHVWADATCLTPKTCTLCDATEGEALGHSRAPATCTVPAKCVRCGSETGSANGHTWVEATCTASKTCSVCGATEGAATGHALGDNKVCTSCGYCDYCKVNTNTAEHPVSCPNNAGYQTTCSKCGTEYVTANGHPDCEVCDGCHATADCPYCAVCWNKPENDKVQAHKTSAHCAECDTVNGHASTCSDYAYPETGSHSLKVWARIWIHETEHKTVLLDTIDNLSGSAKVYQVVAANIDRLESKFPSGYHALHWYETIYYKNEDNEYKTVKTDLTVGDEDDVYVQLYSAEQLVVVNVHTSKSYDYDLSVRIEGFRVGDTVTYNDVKKAVKQYYNVSNMNIYTYSEMEKMLDGKDANKTENFIVKSSNNTYEVFISGSRKGSTYTYTADSSNPKTGDAIFAPAIVMGASFTCLAALFYLNKKRAY